MFKDYPYVVVTMAMLFIVSLIGAVLYFTRKYAAQEKVLFMFMLITTLISAIWCIDNIIAFKIQLLSEKEDDFILQSMTDIIKITLGAIVGAKYFSKDDGLIK